MTWAALFVVFLGIGLAIQRLAGWARIDADRCLMAFWMGFAGAIALLQLWHIAKPVGPKALAAVCGIGLVGLVWNRRELSRWLRHSLPGKGAFLVISALFVLWMANRSAGPCSNIDSGLYHLSSIRWNRTCPIAPGLGNLYYPLALNTASFLYAALLEAGPWRGGSNHVANGLLVVVLGLQCVLGGYRLTRPGRSDSAVSLFSVFLLTPVLLTAGHDWMSSHNPDLVVAMLAFAGATRALALLVSRGTDLKEQGYDVVFVIAVLAAGVCVKLSMVFLMGSCGLLAILVWCWRSRGRSRLTISTIATSCITALLLLLPWTIRGVILSGHVFYPSKICAVSVAWQMPEDVVDRHRASIGRHCYRMEDTAGWRWVSDWVGHLRRDIIVPVAVILIGGVIMLVLLCARRRPREGTTYTGWLLLLPAMAAILAWFLTAPAPRFGYFLFWIAAGACLSMLYERHGPSDRKVFRMALLAGCMVLALANNKKFLVPPPGQGWLHPTPTVAARTFVTKSGLTLYVPADDSSPCWDMQLPCTPYPRADLRLRRRGCLESGFVLDGESGAGPGE